MANFGSFLAHNEYMTRVLPNPRNVVKITHNSLNSPDSATKKQNIFGLIQAEDKFLDFIYTIHGEKLTDIATATFSVFTLDNKELFKYTLDDNLSFENNALTVFLSAMQTHTMTTKYQYELWIRDRAGLDALLFKGALKFTPIVGLPA